MGYGERKANATSAECHFGQLKMCEVAEMSLRASDQFSE